MSVFVLLGSLHREGIGPFRHCQVDLEKLDKVCPRGDDLDAASGARLGWVNIVEGTLRVIKTSLVREGITVNEASVESDDRGSWSACWCWFILFWVIHWQRRQGKGSSAEDSENRKVPIEHPICRSCSYPATAQGLYRLKSREENNVCAIP